MKKIFYIIIPIFVIILIYSMQGSESSSDYTLEAQKKRDEKVKFLASSDQSPFIQSDLPFVAPEYFPINPDYRINALLERVENRQIVNIATSTGAEEKYLKFAYAKFKIQGETLQLLILKPIGFGSMNTYFTAFSDNTSGKETYGGGRYLDLDIGKSDRITIDFNQAYNPYCAYANKYSCPLPPTENILPIAIPAGEKDYKH